MAGAAGEFSFSECPCRHILCRCSSRKQNILDVVFEMIEGTERARDQPATAAGWIGVTTYEA